MTYSDLKVSLNEAWTQFYRVLQSDGVDVEKLDQDMDRKDIFNAVEDCVIYRAPLEIEE